MTQLEIPLARRTDPVTSHAAAARTVSFRAKHEAQIYGAICAAGEHGVNMYEIALATGLEPVQVGRRLSAMGKHGLIVRLVLGSPGFDYKQRNGCAVWFRK